MSAIRGIGDAFAFQRLLWLLVGTVIVPTVLLSLYGVMAIRNQQDAMLTQIRAQHEEQLRVIAAELFARLEDLDQRARAEARRCPATTDEATACPSSLDGVAERWTWSSGAPIPEPMRAIGVPERLTADTRWIAAGDGSGPLATFADDDRAVAWRLDVDALDREVRGLGQARFGGSGQFALLGAEAGPATPIDEMRARWIDPAYTAALPLERPLAQWRLTLTYPDADDPSLAILGGWLYPLGLIALVTTVISGTTITLNSAAREIRLSRLQTDFVSSVSHELRTPLTSIRVFVETLQSGRIEDPVRVQECLDLLAQETDRLSRMIERVLDWAKMEAGRRTYEHEATTPRRLITDALSALRSQHLQLDPSEITIEIADDLPTINADHDAIVEALLNLLQNAVRYCPAPRKLTVSAERRARFIAISVADNGPGIAPRDRKRIFEKFYQADSLLSSVSQMGANRGSGLGLSIVRAIVWAHGGRVELQSELGRGSRFSLLLPVA